MRQDLGFNGVPVDAESCCEAELKLFIRQGFPPAAAARMDSGLNCWSLLTTSQHLASPTPHASAVSLPRERSCLLFAALQLLLNPSQLWPGLSGVLGAITDS